MSSNQSCELIEYIIYFFLIITERVLPNVSLLLSCQIFLGLTIDFIFHFLSDPEANLESLASCFIGILFPVPSFVLVCFSGLPNNTQIVVALNNICFLHFTWRPCIGYGSVSGWSSSQIKRIWVQTVYLPSSQCVLLFWDSDWRNSPDLRHMGLVAGEEKRKKVK